MSKGRSLRLFLADGTPGGIITAEIMNWTGHVMTAPRSRLVDLIQRSEAARTGVYILSGGDPDGGYKPLAYVGETDSIRKRLAQHNKDDAKEFWEQTCIITSKDQNLTKAHVRYLESRMIQIAAEAGRAILTNGTAPDMPHLPEADQSDMEFFIDQLRVVLPVLGLDLLKGMTRVMAAPTLTTTLTPATEVAFAPVAVTFELVSKKYDFRAQAREVEGEFIVLAGSQAQGSWIGVPGGYQALRQQLMDEGVLSADETLADNAGEGGFLRFSRDYAFTKPSAAAAVILGRSSNGRIEWRVQGTQTTYADWQDAQVAALAPSQGDDA
jgi:hypothetical protein